MLYAIEILTENRNAIFYCRMPLTVYLIPISKLFADDQTVYGG